MVQEAAIDAIVGDPRFRGFRGWHGHYASGSAAYTPVIQQDREEFIAFLRNANAVDALSGRCLTLGLGMAGGMHAVFSAVCRGGARTIDWDIESVERYRGFFPGVEGLICGEFGTPDVIAAAAADAPYSLLFIDGTHAYDYVRTDFENYAPMVRPGGVVAFHDANAESYPEVARFVDELRIAGHRVNIVEPFRLGIAWIVKL